MPLLQREGFSGLSDREGRRSVYVLFLCDDVSYTPCQHIANERHCGSGTVEDVMVTTFDRGIRELRDQKAKLNFKFQIS